MIRTLWVYAMGIVLTAYNGLDVLIHAALKSKRLDAVSDRAPKRWARGILRAAGVKVRYEGGHLLPKDTAQVLISNHQSWFDVFALSGTLPVHFKFVGKKELADVFLFGSAWLAAGHYAIDRGDRQSAIDSLREVGELIKEGRHTVIMFPEGTRSPTGDLARFKKGAFLLAIDAQVPIVPVAVIGSREIMPKGRWKITPGTVTVRVGEPIQTVGLTPEDRDHLTKVGREAVARLKGELPQAEPPKTPTPSSALGT